MGSKTTSKLACDVCESKFQTAQALRTHRNAKHSKELKRETSPDSLPKNTPSRRPRASMRLRKGHEDTESDTDSQMDENLNKIQFSCPKCEKIYPIYFQAMKHIQKKHCEDSDGNSVSADSQDIIKPVSIETCNDCNEPVEAYHFCDRNEEDPHSNILYCLGCDRKFRSVSTFNQHSTQIHRNNLDSMFFKTVEEFNTWKQMLETQLKVKYLTLKKTGTQKYYQCNYVSPKNESYKTYLCPSIIEAKELASGIQIYYNIEHHEHVTPEYSLPKEFAHHRIKKKDAFDVLLNKNPDKDLYVQFKNLMDNIILDAAKVSIPHLKKLFNTALEMQGIVNSYDEDNDDKDVPLITKSMTDSQITDALEGKRSSARLKRKSETVPVEVKKTKKEAPEDDTKANDDTKNVSKENKDLNSPFRILSPTFNDTYKQFLGPLDDTPKKAKMKPKEVVKTKMGQFSPKKKIVKDTVEKKPNILKPTKVNLVKDIKYEVKEQENDCNILILKI